MRNDRVRLWTSVLLAIAILLGCQAAFAQVRIVGSINGKVQDPSGAVVPGAKVVLKDEGTGISKEIAASGEGTFGFPDLSHGTYQITAGAPGFQQGVVQHIEVIASQTTDITVTLQVGQATETVTVEGVAPVLETSSNLVTNTQNTKLVNELPTGSRAPALAFALLAPGYTGSLTGGGRIDNVGGGAVSTTVDGINNASNGYKSGGTVWYGTVPVRLGALEEVSVEAGGLGADAGAESGVNVKMITRRGSSSYHGSGFYQPMSEQFNANSWSRNATPGQGFRTYNRTHNFGGNFGGKLIPFGYLKDKLFFFVNYEYQWIPSVNSVTTAIMTPAAETGVYTYLVNGTTNQYQSVNVLTLAKAAGFPSTIDPVVASYMTLNDQIKQYSSQTFTTDPNRLSYVWKQQNSTQYYYPTTRVDYYLTPKEQLTFTWNLDHEWFPGNNRFPFPDSKFQGPFRIGGYFVWAAALQSTISANSFNEFRYGVQHSGDSNASATANYGSYNTYNGQPLRIGNPPNATSNLPFGTITPYLDQQNTTGRHFITTIYDTYTKIHGQHTIRAGASFRDTIWKDVWEVFPYSIYGMGTPSGDPIPGTIFTAANLPGDAPGDLPGGPANLYNQLTGRVSQATFRTVVNPDTKQFGNFLAYNWTRSYMGGLWAQDSWRVKPNLTVNFGLRWEVQGNMFDPQGLSTTPSVQDMLGPSTSLFSPGSLGGTNDPIAKPVDRTYNPDYLNFAPNLGIAWNPNVTSGFLGKLLGGSKTAIRTSFSMSYFDEGTLMYSGAYQCGPGQGIGCNAGKNAQQTIVAGTNAALPQFSTLSQVAANPLTLPTYTAIGAYQPVLHQNTQTFATSFAGMKPTLVAPYLETWNFSIQRELTKGTVLEVRYVGNATHRQWRTFDLNETNIFENGFLNEFQIAQNNLAVANGLTVAQLTSQPTLPNCPSTNGLSPYCLKTLNFANAGLPGQKDLPILSAAFGPRGTVPAIQGTSGFASSTFAGYLENGSAGSFANALNTNTYFCRLMGNSFSPCLGPNSGAATGQSYNAPGAGFPINFFRVNPYTTSMNYVDDVGFWSYEGLQLQLRKTFSRGLTSTVNYSWSHGMSNTGADNATQSQNFNTLRNEKLDRRPSPFDQRHTVSSYTTYDLPIGKGKLVNLGNKWLDMAFGEWTTGQIFQFSTGAPVQIGGAYSTFNTFAPTGIQLPPGVSLSEFSDIVRNTSMQKINQGGGAFQVNRGNVTDLQRLAVPVSWVAGDGRANQQLIGWNTTPGTMGQILYIPNINNWAWNVSLMKNYRITERLRFQLYGEAQNIMNHPTWALPNLTPSSTTFGVVGAPSGSRTMTFRGLFSF
jgi:hypothetical protein